MPGYWSWSQFSSFVECGKKFELHYIDRKPTKPKGYFVGGHAIHATIEECESSGWWGDVERFQGSGEALEFFHHELEAELLKVAPDGVIDWGGRKTKAHPGGEDLRWWHTMGPSMLRRYSSLRRQDHAQGFPLPLVEVEVSFMGPQDKPVKGYIDQLFRPKAHEVGTFNGLVRDWKTGSRFTPDHPLQLVNYAKAAKERGLGEITRGQFIYLRASDGRLVYDVDLSPWFEVYEMLMAEWAAGIQDGKFVHRPGWQCRTCDVAAFCEVGRRISGEESGEAEPSDGAQAKASLDSGGPGV